jgi:hypothetical protein
LEAEAPRAFQEQSNRRRAKHFVNVQSASLSSDLRGAQATQDFIAEACVWLSIETNEI